MADFYPSSKLTRGQKLVLIGSVIGAAGYATFADFMVSLYLMLPLREEYRFEEKVAEPPWILISAIFAGIYGLSTLISEGKSSYDGIRKYLAKRNPNYLDVIRQQPPEIKAPPGKAMRVFVYITPRFVTVVSSVSDSAETTMGLFKENSSLTKIASISSLSFLGSYFFYGPVTIDAMEEIFLGKVFPKDDKPYGLTAKVLGYPIAFFSAIEDMLECAASMFKNFNITSSGGRWTIVGISSLTGISGVFLDGKMGVEVIDHFMTHLETHYTWLPQALLCRSRPQARQVYQLLYEASGVSLAAFGASYIAFADRELVSSLTSQILTTLGAEVPYLPDILGWCVVSRDFIIKTYIFNGLEYALLDGIHQGWKKIRRGGANPDPEGGIELQEVAIHRPLLEAPEELGEEKLDLEEDREDVGLISGSLVEAPKKTWLPGFFGAKPKGPNRDYLLPERRQWGCGIM